jgi:hypothetical protein
MISLCMPITPLERFEERAPVTVFVVSPNSDLRQEFYDKLGLPRWNVIQVAALAGSELPAKVLSKFDGNLHAALMAARST